VPSLRGKEKDRRSGDILDEVRTLTRQGVIEVTLLGQNVNAYGVEFGDKYAFSKLLTACGDLEKDGLERVRFTSPHPKDFTDDVIEAMAQTPNVMPSLHMPLQSGSDRILKLMNRKYTLDEYYKKTQAAKKILPELVFSSDFIVGFPGETAADFEMTVYALKMMEYESIFAFNYSVRPGTEAEKFDDNIPLAEKTARLETIISIQEEITAKRYGAMVGTAMPVLVEGASRRDERAYMGRTLHNRILNFTSEKPVDIGAEIMVTLTEVKRNSLYGKTAEIP
jgi:tRNA-2-methylthio-N6-dimethylallyladenosine synthase